MNSDRVVSGTVGLSVAGMQGSQAKRIPLKDLSDPETNEIVWEWFNVVARGERKDLVGRVTRAFRYDPDYPSFIGKDCPG